MSDRVEPPAVIPCRNSERWLWLNGYVKRNVEYLFSSGGGINKATGFYSSCCCYHCFFTPCLRNRKLTWRLARGVCASVSDCVSADCTFNLTYTEKANCIHHRLSPVPSSVPLHILLPSIHWPFLLLSSSSRKVEKMNTDVISTFSLKLCLQISPRRAVLMYSTLILCISVTAAKTAQRL